MASRDNQMNSQMQPTNLQIQLDGAHINASTAVSSKSNAVEHPLERLTKVVAAISHASLTTAVADISSVVSMVDGMAGSAPGNGCRATVGEDLVATIKCCRQARTLLTPNGNSGTKRPNHALIEEIAEINQRLIDTEVEIIDEDVVQTAVASAAEGGEGIIVKCSYKAVALSLTLKYKLTSAQMCHIQPLILLIPTDYPNSSPIHLDKSPAVYSGEYEYFSMKVNIFLRNLSQPVSLSKVARTWDICVRAVVSEFAQQRGGGTFSTKYGVL